MDILFSHGAIVTMDEAMHLYTDGFLGVTDGKISYLGKTPPPESEKPARLIDASGMVVGRLASQVASMLRGKHKPTYTPHVDTGDYIIVVNTDKMVFTGKKLDSKIYYRHSGYVGGLKETTARRMMEKKSETVLKEAVRGMLPKGPLGYAMLTKLHLYAGAEHEHQAQKPVAFEVK